MANQIGDKTFNWSSSVNFTLPKSKLIAFPNLEKSSSYAQIYSVGQALNILKTLKMTGVDPATGLYTFFDFNGDGAISSPADRQVISVLGQKFSGGFQNVFNYKRWQLDFLIQFVKQTGTIYANNVGIAPGGMSNQPTVVLARWQKPNDITNIQKYTINEGSTSYGQAQAWGDLTIGDASYIRLKNLALAYQLPQQLIGKFGAKITKVYLQSQNLITISKFLGLDPESQNFLSLPPLSVISLGLQVSF